LESGGRGHDAPTAGVAAPALDRPTPAAPPWQVRAAAAQSTANELRSRGRIMINNIDRWCKKGVSQSEDVCLDPSERS
jgi:hypothetical protein